MSFSSGRNISNNVNTDEAQTLTNKTIDSANNSLVVDADTATVSNIEADNLKAGVIDDDLSTTSVNDDTVPSAKAAKAYTDAAAATAASDLSTHEADTSTHGVSGDIVGTSDTQTLTNKTIQGASVETPSRLDAKKDTLNNLETYATTATDGELTYATDDEKFYGVVNNELVSLGGGLGSAQTIFTIEADTVNVAADMDGNDSTFGGNDASALTGTLSQSTTASELLTGVKKVNKYEAAASSQFDYFGYTRAIPQGWAGRTVAVEFTYRNNANTSNDDYTFNVKDETNNSVLLTRSLEAKVSADGNGETLRYLVNIPTDCLSVTVGFQNVGTATDTALFFDKVSMDIDDFNYKNVSEYLEMRATGGAAIAITADVTPIPFTEVSDELDVWDGDTFTAPWGGTFEFDGMINEGATDYYVRAWKSTDGGSSYSYEQALSNFAENNTIVKLNGKFDLNTGDKIQLRASANTTIAGTTPFHYLNISGRRTSKHVVVDSGEADTEYYKTTDMVTANFWDSTAATSNFDISLIPLTGSNFIEYNDTTQTRIVAKQDIEITVLFSSEAAADQGVAIYDSSGNELSRTTSRTDAGTRVATTITKKLSAGDYIYGERIGGGANRSGGLQITARKATLGEYHLVPVNDQENVFSAWISNNGTASIRSQSSPFIESVTRTAQGVVQVNFKSGIFTQLPSVVGSVLTGGGSTITEQIQGLNTTGFQVVTKQIGNVFDSDFLVTVQKQGADYNEPKAFIGDVPLNYFQRKDLDSDKGSTTDITSSMGFNNLVIGKTYRLMASMHMRTTTNTASCRIEFTHDGTKILDVRESAYNGGSVNDTTIFSNEVTFVATATTITAQAIPGAGTIDSDTTYAILTELNHTRETTRF